MSPAGRDPAPRCLDFISSIELKFHGTDTDTDIRDAPIVQFCKRVHARIPNGHPGEEKRACRTKVRGQVGEEVRVGVRVGPVEFKLNTVGSLRHDDLLYAPALR